MSLAEAGPTYLCAAIASIGEQLMALLKLRDGTDLYFKDWGSGKPILFSHGWPLSADMWDAQMLSLIHI